LVLLELWVALNGLDVYGTQCNELASCVSFRCFQMPLITAQIGELVECDESLNVRTTFRMTVTHLYLFTYFRELLGSRAGEIQTLVHWMVPTIVISGTMAL